VRQSLASWIADRHPPPVVPLDRWTRTAGVVEDGDRVDMLTMLATSALESALARPGKEREGAFHLLAADALLTYACEAALETNDVEGALLRILGSASER
jgi:hypothetical protein